jgi:hypothetical protein
VWDADEIAELGKEELAVGAFGGAGGGPASDERGDGVCGQVKAVADKYLKSDALVIAVVKPETRQ